MDDARRACRTDKVFVLSVSCTMEHLAEACRGHAGLGRDAGARERALLRTDDGPAIVQNLRRALCRLV